MIRIELVLYFVLLPTFLYAELPDGPTAQPSTPATNVSAELVKGAVQPGPAKTVVGRERSGRDNQLLVLTIASFASLVYDAETTRAAIANGGVESNPLFGRNPSRATIYAIGLPIHAGYALLSYRIRRGRDHTRRSLGLVPQAGLITTHLVAGSLNLRYK